MGTLRFGKREEITCIVDIDARGAGGEPLCLAFKTSSYWVGGGVYLSDDGYVLKPRGQDKVYYPMAKGAPVEGLPDPLPAYSIPWIDYFGGYSLWFAIAFAIAWGLGANKLKMLRRTKFAATLSATPVTYGPAPREDQGRHVRRPDDRPAAALRRDRPASGVHAALGFQ